MIAVIRIIRKKHERVKKMKKYSEYAILHYRNLLASMGETIVSIHVVGPDQWGITELEVVVEGGDGTLYHTEFLDGREDLSSLEWRELGITRLLGKFGIMDTSQGVSLDGGKSFPWSSPENENDPILSSLLSEEDKNCCIAYAAEDYVIPDRDGLRKELAYLLSQIVG